MNYIMGYLFINVRNEELTLKIFISLINQHFHNIFTKDLRKLKLLFYQFDRCLHIFLPELFEKFKVFLSLINLSAYCKFIYFVYIISKKELTLISMQPLGF